MPFFNKKTKEMKQQMDMLRASDADLQQEATISVNKDTDHKKISASSTQQESYPFQFIPLTMGGGGRTHVPSEGSRNLIENEVTLEDLKKVTEKFYELAFQDKTLDNSFDRTRTPTGTALPSGFIKS